ncbi:MAG: hypothetical protein K2Y28_11780 [Burkholderiaceae bacterium]|nr:hypothetical protein [Burkholderiaceae bacterium]
MSTSNQKNEEIMEKLTKAQREKIEDALCAVAVTCTFTTDIAERKNALIAAMSELNAIKPSSDPWQFVVGASEPIGLNLPPPSHTQLPDIQELSS